MYMWTRTRANDEDQNRFFQLVIPVSNPWPGYHEWQVGNWFWSRLSNSRFSVCYETLSTIRNCKMALGRLCLWKKKRADGSQSKTVHILLAFFFLVNYSLGTGFLAHPYSFLHAGYLAAIPTLIVIVLVTWIYASWILESMARAQVNCWIVYIF